LNDQRQRQPLASRDRIEDELQHVARRDRGRPAVSVESVFFCAAVSLGCAEATMLLVVGNPVYVDFFTVN